MSDKQLKLFLSNPSNYLSDLYIHLCFLRNTIVNIYNNNENNDHGFKYKNIPKKPKYIRKTKEPITNEYKYMYKHE